MSEKTIKEMNLNDLQNFLHDLRKEQLDLRISHVHKQLKNTVQLKIVRRNIARVKTQMTVLIGTKGKKND